MIIEIKLEVFGSREPHAVDITEEIALAIKPLLDKYHTSAKINVSPTTHTMTVNGAWNG